MNAFYLRNEATESEWRQFLENEVEHSEFDLIDLENMSRATALKRLGYY